MRPEYDITTKEEDNEIVTMPEGENESYIRTSFPDKAACVELGIPETEASPKPDPNTVDWDERNDPQNPIHWPKAKNWTNIATVSLLSILK